MHAYLIVGQIAETKIYADKLAAKLGAKIMEFPLGKISETRELSKITRLAFNSPTAIFIPGIDEATEEALNAFLKNLEEPQENILYILAALNLRNVLPTIVSRCEVIKITDEGNKEFDKDSENFLTMPIGKKLAYVDKIKDRGDAKELVTNLIDQAHFNLLNSDGSKLKTVMDLEILIKTVNNLKLNGNVGLQLTNMAINLS